MLHLRLQTVLDYNYDAVDADGDADANADADAKADDDYNGDAYDHHHYQQPHRAAWLSSQLAVSQQKRKVFMKKI